MTTQTMHSNEAILTASDRQAIKMIKENLAISDKWVRKAVLVIYAAQTKAEQETESTHEDNGVGFNGADAHILSSFAQQIQAFENGTSRYRTALSDKQMALARRKITKYARQLLEVARAKQAPAKTEYSPEADEWKAEMAEVDLAC